MKASEDNHKWFKNFPSGNLSLSDETNLLNFDKNTLKTLVEAIFE